MFRSIKLVIFSWRTIARLILVYIVPFLLITGVLKLSSILLEQAMEAPTRIPTAGLVGLETLPPKLKTALEQKINLKMYDDEATMLVELEADSISLGLVLPENFYNSSDTIPKGTINIYYNIMRRGLAMERVMEVLYRFNRETAWLNVQSLGVSQDRIEPIKIQKNNTFNPLMMLGKAMSQVKLIVANVINLLWMLLLVWLARRLVLRITEHYNIASFLPQFLASLLMLMTAMILVFIGVQVGLQTEVEGLMKSFVANIQQLLTWNKLSATTYLWIPTWCFILGLLGMLSNVGVRILYAYERTFWGVVVLLLFAFYACANLNLEHSWWLYVPILNVFGVGQLSMQGSLSTEDWMLATSITTGAASFCLLLWFLLSRRRYTLLTEEAGK